MAITSLFFDIDNTLYDTSKFAERARRNAINAMRESGLKASEQRAYRTLLSVIKRRTSNYDYHFDEMLKELGEKRRTRLIAAGVVAYHNTKASILPFPDVKRTILGLRESGYRVYVASQGNSLKQWDKLIRLGLHLLFHDVFVTDDMGVGKSRQFYAGILREIGTRPEQALMVGDSVKTDIEPAKAAGMHTVLFSRKGGRSRGADHAIKSLSELPGLLKKMGGGKNVGRGLREGRQDSKRGS